MRQGELAAIVSDAPEDLRPERRDLLAHLRVLDEAAAQGTVPPMRFGSVSVDDETVTAALAERTNGRNTSSSVCGRWTARRRTTSRPTMTRKPSSA